MISSDQLQSKGLDQRAILRRLFELGHFHNPQHPTGVKAEEIDSLSLEDKEAQKAVLSYQEYLAADLNAFSSEHHGRPAIADGDPGPATLDLITMPRCGCPDYRIPGDARSAIAEANWPTACRGHLKFGRMFKALPGMSEADTAKVWWAICNNWTQALSDVEMTPAEVGDRAIHIWAGIQRLAGSTLAWSYLARNSCSVSLEQAYNATVRWALDLACATGSHEVGHALGFEHDSDPNSLMYPSIQPASKSRLGYPNDSDMRQATKLGYKPSGLPQLPRERLFSPRTSGPTEPDSPSGELTISGPPAEIRLGAKVVGRLVIVPVKEF